MKSMVLKDLYNIKCNAKSVLVSFLILAVAMASTGGRPLRRRCPMQQPHYQHLRLR